MATKKKVLVVDDEPGVTLLTKVNLEETGLYRVCEENRAVDALQSARRFKPDLILLDVMMPGMDGGDVAAQIKSDAALRDTPIVFLTATVLREEVEASLGRIGGHPFIPKPVSVQSLLDCVRQNVKIKTKRRSSRSAVL
jgi:two-component system OmpR family response regulator